MQYSGVNELKVNTIKGFQIQPDDLYSPMTRSRNRQFFVTQKNIEANISQIANHHQRLNNYIDSLQQKVNRKVESNEAQILEAYRNHVALVKKDLEELRKETQAQANSSNSFEEQIQYLEKKLVVFREEALRLFGKLSGKDKEIQQLKMKVEELTAEKKYMDQSMKQITKQNKQFQAYFAQLSDRDRQKQQQQDFTLKFDISQLNANACRQKQYRHKNRTTLTSANLSKGISNNNNVGVPRHLFSYNDKEEFLLSKDSAPEVFVKKIRPKLDYLETDLKTEIIRVAEQTFEEVVRKGISKMEYPSSQRLEFERGKYPSERGATRISMKSKSNRSAYESEDKRRRSTFDPKSQELAKQSKRFNMRQEMSGYFVRCVETIKKDITRKKQMNSLSFYKEGNPLSFQQFKRLDWYKLMQLALSNQKVIEGLYNLLLSIQE